MKRLQFAVIAMAAIALPPSGCSKSGQFVPNDGATSLDVVGDSNGTGGGAAGGDGDTSTGTGGTAVGGSTGSGGSGGFAGVGGGGRSGSGAGGGSGTSGAGGSAGSEGGSSAGGQGGMFACGNTTCVLGVSYCDRGTIGGTFNPDAGVTPPSAHCSGLQPGCSDCTCLCAARNCSSSTGAQCSCSGSPPTVFQCGLP